MRPPPAEPDYWYRVRARGSGRHGQVLVRVRPGISPRVSNADLRRNSSLRARYAQLGQAAAQLELALDRHVGGAVAVDHTGVILEPVFAPQLLDAPRERFRVLARGTCLARVGSGVARHQIRKMLIKNRQEAVADGGIESQRPGVHELGAGVPRGGEQCVQMSIRSEERRVGK